MGRPRIGQKHKVSIGDDDLDELHLIAAARGVSVQDVIRDAIHVYVKRVRRGGRAA